MGGDLPKSIAEQNPELLKILVHLASARI